MKSPAKSQILTLLAILALVMGMFVAFQRWSPFALNPEKVFGGAGGPPGECPPVVGVQVVERARALALFPEAKGRPIVLTFTSEYCLDCKRLKPALEKALKAHPKLYSVRLDIRNDQKQYPEVFKAFKPSVAPTLVFIAPDGDIRETLSGAPESRELERALKSLEQNRRREKCRQEGLQRASRHA